MILTPISKINKSEILNEINTDIYTAICTRYNISIKFGQQNYTYYEPTLKTITNRIFKYSNSELLFYHEQTLYYKNMNELKPIIQNIDINYWNILYFDIHKKFVLISNNDSPDHIHIFSVSDLINCYIDIENINPLISFRDWNSASDSDDNYFYYYADNRLIIIDIKTNQIYKFTVPFTNSEKIQNYYDYDFYGLYELILDNDMINIYEKTELSDTESDTDEFEVHLIKIKWNPLNKKIELVNS